MDDYLKLNTNGADLSPRVGDANYVQLIHTDYNATFDIFPLSLLKTGTSRMTADVDVLVRGLNILDPHSFVLFIHMTTALKKSVLVANERNHRLGGYEWHKDFANPNDVTLQPHQILVGIYGQRNETKLGVYKIDLLQNGKLITDSIHHLKPHPQAALDEIKKTANVDANAQQKSKENISIVVMLL